MLIPLPAFVYVYAYIPVIISLDLGLHTAASGKHLDHGLNKISRLVSHGTVITAQDSSSDDASRRKVFHVFREIPQLVVRGTRNENFSMRFHEKNALHNKQ